MKAVLKEHEQEQGGAEWETVIGLEVHAQVSGASKLFSQGGCRHDAPPNTQVSLFDVAMPGSLPVLNATAVDQAIRAGLALGAQINLISRFDRKNYFYPDLPAGYQISQFKHPIVGEGALQISTAGRMKSVRIERIHLEQDAGKLLHDIGAGDTHVDFNRAGVPLMEIVSRPDMRSGDEAAAFLSELRYILRYFGICDGNMEQGSLRADVNVSLRRPGGALGTRTETKNVNSIRFLKMAVAYEEQRQAALLEAGHTVAQQTRLFDPDKGETRLMRSKEDAHDYRYFPCPDLHPLIIEEARLERLKQEMPEHPAARKARFCKTHALSPAEADALLVDRATGDYFEALCAKGCKARMAASWITGEIFSLLRRTGTDMKDCPLQAAQLAEVLALVDKGALSGRQAKQVVRMMEETKRSPASLIEELGIVQISDTQLLGALIEKLVRENPDKVAQLRKKPKALGWFVGQIMQKTQGAANPRLVDKLLRAELGIDS